MDILDVKSGEKLAYICLMVSPALIGIVAVLLSFSPDYGVEPKMFVAMIICFAISLYFAMQYKMHTDENKKSEAYLIDFKNSISAADASDEQDVSKTNTKSKTKK